MITCVLKGGLGNQLFQIFTTIAYSFRSKSPFVFPFVETIPGDTPRPTYWTTLLNGLYKYTNVDGLITNNVLESFYKYRGDHGYTEIPVNIAITYEGKPLDEQRVIPRTPTLRYGVLTNHNNICLDGFFQSYKYFDAEYPRIYELLDIDGLKTQTNFPESPADMPTVSLHFRVGDYADKRCYHPVLPIIYYERALKHIAETTQDTSRFRIYVFFEEKDIQYVRNAISQLQRSVPHAEFEFVTEQSDWKQMILMSKCNHHIIANSTCSWWGATFASPFIDGFGTSPKIVCYPSIWYGHQLYYINTRDLFHPGWSKIEFTESEMDKSYCTCFSEK